VKDNKEWDALSRAATARAEAATEPFVRYALFKLAESYRLLGRGIRKFTPAGWEH
jgi:hypothetical protein